MSTELRRTIMYWFTLLAGIAIVVMQIYKYFNDSLELTIEEGCVTIFAVVLMKNPNIFSDGFKAFIKKKADE